LSINLSDPIVSMRGIGKIFGKVRVLENIDFDIHPGEVHILAGENGAGKSTLIKILSGVYSSSKGTILMNGDGINPHTPLEANSLGISVIHQELSLVPSMSIKDNLFLGRPHTRAGFILDKEHHKQAFAILSDMGIHIDINEKIENIPISIQQLIEIAKAISINAKVIIMDEPSSALNAKDVEILFSLIDKLKIQGAGIVYISHRMEEIERLADRITVLRDGKLIGTALAEDLPISQLINWMVGRDLTGQIPRPDTSTGIEKLKIQNLTVNSRAGKKTVENVSFSVDAGEILGISGLQGSGASELLMGIFGGYKTKTANRLFLNGEEVVIKSPADAIKKHIALLTNDRKATGLVLPMSLTANFCMAGMKELTKWGWRSSTKENLSAKKYGTELSIRAHSYDMEVNMLSGGNQQKVAIGKWMLTLPEILLLDEPTRGIDIGAKHEIYQLMNEWTKKGISILLITSEMPELLAMSDRILVMHRGAITAEYMRNEFNAEKILESAMGKEKL